MTASARRPAEWEPHSAVWTAWPYLADWGEHRDAARAELSALCEAIAADGGEEVRVLVHGEETRRDAEARLTAPGITLVDLPYGDIWLRDIGPVFLRRDGRVEAACFRWNGWGGKYELPHDDAVSEAICAREGVTATRHPFVLEGGAIDVDGAGWCLTTEQCLLNPNRNPSMSRADVERALAESLFVDRVVWLGDGLENDHTDGHVDTLARFVAPGRVVCMEPQAGDPNADALNAVIARLRDTDLEVCLIPSPGEVRGADGALVPASYANFYIGNRTVAVPTYDTPHDDAAVAAIAALFPDRRTVGLSARAILTGGGAFHCITQEQP